MIIAFDITQSIYGTGVSAYITNLIAAFDKLKPDNLYFKFFAFTKGKLSSLKNLKTKYQSNPNFSFYLFPLPEKIRHLSLKLKLDPSYLIGSYDLLHTPDWVGYHTKKPTLATIHDLAIHHYPQTFPKTIISHQTRYLNWAAHTATHIICVSNTTQTDLHHFYPNTQTKTTVIYEANPFEFDSPANWGQVVDNYSILTSQKYFITIATLEPRKNLNHLIKAFIQTKLPNHQLLIAGKIGWGRVKKISHPQIKFLGYVPSNYLITLLHHSQGLLYTPLWEGFGLPITAAIDYNLPILTSNQGATAEIAPPSAVLVNPFDVSDITQGIIKLTQLPKPKYKSPFSWLETARLTLQLYHHILKS